MLSLSAMWRFIPLCLIYSANPATAITDYLTSNENFDPQHCVSLLQHSLKKKADDVLASIEGYEISPEQQYRIDVVRDHLHYIEKLIERVDACINAMVEKYDGAISLLCTITGIDRSSAIMVISGIGVDMIQFGSSKRLCCWAGLTPGNNESAGKKKSVHISRAEVYLKPAAGASCPRSREGQAESLLCSQI